MLDSDISTADALAHLSVADRADDRAAFDRRRFLQLIGMGIGAGAVGSVLGSPVIGNFMPGYDASAWAAGPIGPNDGILVIIGMYGGNDGLNMVVPVSDTNYVTQHGSIALNAANTLPIDADTGLHPNLVEVKRRWDLGQVAIVEGLGYPNADLSHFTSMATWMSGRPGVQPTSGWMGRWLDRYLSGNRDLFAGAAIGGSVPLTVVGASSVATAVPSSQPTFGADLTDAERLRSTAIRAMATPAQGALHQAVGTAFGDALDVGKTLAPVIPDPLGTTGALSKSLEVGAHVVNANLGFRVLTVGWGDFDSHASQTTMQGQRMLELDEGIRRFYEVLAPEWADRVTVMTFSEFGRTSWANSSGGTDHGTAAPHFVIGNNVKGGRYGQRPSLAGLARWQRPAHHVDLRSYYASVLDSWMGGGSSELLGGTFENLGLFNAGPGQPIT
jgi:uncharacterized protein (DUF1501 family)